MFKDIGLIFFGWLLGLLAPAISAWAASRKRTKEIREGIKTELTQLRYRLGSLALQVAIQLGTLDRPLIEWFKSLADTHKGVGPIEGSLRSVVAKVLESDDEQLAAVLSQAKGQEGVSLIFVRYGTPFLDSSLSQLSDLPPKSHAKLLEIQAQVSFLHTLVDEANHLHHLTFDESIGESNRERIQKNIRQTYARIGQLAQIIADIIGSDPLPKRGEA